jgi:hypothetical protein
MWACAATAVDGAESGHAGLDLDDGFVYDSLGHDFDPHATEYSGDVGSADGVAAGGENDGSCFGDFGSDHNFLVYNDSSSLHGGGVSDSSNDVSDSGNLGDAVADDENDDSDLGVAAEIVPDDENSVGNAGHAAGGVAAKGRKNVQFEVPIPVVPEIANSLHAEFSSIYSEIFKVCRLKDVGTDTLAAAMQCTSSL